MNKKKNCPLGHHKLPFRASQNIACCIMTLYSFYRRRFIFWCSQYHITVSLALLGLYAQPILHQTWQPEFEGCFLGFDIAYCFQLVLQLFSSTCSLIFTSLTLIWKHDGKTCVAHMGRDAVIISTTSVLSNRLHWKGCLGVLLSLFDLIITDNMHLYMQL